MEPDIMQVVKFPDIRQKKRKGFFHEWHKNKTLFMMLIPGLILMLLFSYLPMFGVLIAFKDFHYYENNFFINFLRSKWVGLENFKFFIKTPDVWIITRNTVAYNLVFIFLGNLLAMFSAIGLYELKNKWAAKFHQRIMLFPNLLSWVVISYLFFGFLSVDKGILNRSILPALGRTPIAWYTEPRFWPFILVFANIFKYLGYNSIIYFAALMAIDHEYYEAAAIDGASKWQQIFKITIPLLSPTMIILVLFGIGRIFNADFGLFYQVPLNSGPLFKVTNVIDTYVYRGLMYHGDIGMTSAAGLYQSLVGFILVLAANTVIRRIDKQKALF